MDSFEMQLPTPTCTASPSNIGCFVDAIKSLLDESDITTIHALATRINPFRIDFQRVIVGDAVSVKPVLVLEHGEPPEFKTLHQSHPSYLSPEQSTASICRTKPDFPLASQHAHGAGEDVDMYFSPRAATSRSPAATDDCFLMDPEADVHGVGAAGDEYRSSFGTAAAYDALKVSNKVCRPDGHMSGRGQGGGTARKARYLVADTASHFSSPSSFTAAASVRCIDGGASSARSPGPFGSHLDDLDMSQVPLPDVYAPMDMEHTMSLPTPPWQQKSTSCPGPPLHGAAPAGGEARQAAKEAMDGDAVRQKVLFAARTCIRGDFLPFLQANLARWSSEGLWPREASQDVHVHGAAPRGYEKLRNAYSCVCRLDRRMRDDPIRTRIALVLLHLEYEHAFSRWKTRRRGASLLDHRQGRGTASAMIDSILDNIHPEWRLADARMRAELRADFHNRKRYGKRWWILANALGPSILILCSAKIAGSMNTPVTITMLRAVADTIRSSESVSLRILRLVNPIADSLLGNHGYQGHDTNLLLEELARLRLPVVEDEDGHGVSA